MFPEDKQEKQSSCLWTMLDPAALFLNWNIDSTTCVQKFQRALLTGHTDRKNYKNKRGEGVRKNGRERK